MKEVHVSFLVSQKPNLQFPSLALLTRAFPVTAGMGLFLPSSKISLLFLSFILSKVLLQYNI